METLTRPIPLLIVRIILFMLSSLNQPSARSLVLNLVVAIGAVLAINGLIFALGWGTSNTTPQLPPGYVVGGVWVVLFALMATARWQLNAYALNQASPTRNWVTILMISCLLYPFYSLAINSQVGGLLGNLGTITLSAFVVVQVWLVSKFAAFLILPVILWVAFATTTILKDLGWL